MPRSGLSRSRYHATRMRFRAAGLAAIALCVAGTACTRRSRPAPVPRAYLFQKGAYQALYAPDGFLLRLLYDRNKDGIADVVTVYRAGGRVEQVETDTNLDGIVDRWEKYDDQQRLAEIDSSHARPGKPDTWEYFDRSGAMVRRETDDRGDGTVHRVERYAAGTLVAVELDTDGNGRADRWQTWRNGRLVSEDLDTDGDSAPDRRLVYGPSGEFSRLEKLR